MKIGIGVAEDPLSYAPQTNQRGGNVGTSDATFC